MKHNIWTTIFCGMAILFLTGAGIASGMVGGTRTYIPMVVKQDPPTATPEPTAEPTPIPSETPAPAGVSVLPNHSYYIDSIDYLHIVGEVMNNTSNHLRYVKVIVDVFNSSGQLVGTDYTYVHLDNLPAQDKTCFDLLMPAPAGWSTYQFEPTTYRTDGSPLPNLTVIGDSGSIDNTFGWYRILGMVRNDQGVVVEYVSPVGTVYNNAGTVIGCDYTYVSSTDLNPDQSSSFELLFMGHDYDNVSKYRIQVDGNPQ